MSILTMVYWNGESESAGCTRWALRCKDKTRDLELPNDEKLKTHWEKVVPPVDGKSLNVHGRYVWGCLVDIPKGTKKDRRLNFIALVEHDAATHLLQKNVNSEAR